MSNSTECKEIVTRYLRARIPVIAIRTIERKRALEIISEIGLKLNMSIFVHTLTQGMRDLLNNRGVNEDRSVVGAVDFIGQQFSQKQNLNFVFTDIEGIDQESQLTRQIMDLVALASETSNSIIIVGDNPLWLPIQRQGMSLTLDPPDDNEMYEILRGTLEPLRGPIRIDWNEADYRQASSILAGITEIEAVNVASHLAANDKREITREHITELNHVKDRMFSNISGLEKVKTHADELSIAGLSGLQKWLNDNKAFMTADLSERKLRPPRGVLLVGVPGCGKSLSAKSIAVSWNLPLFRLDMASIQGMYVGQSEQRLKEALATADRVAPCVLWIDEIEKGLSGGGGDGGVTTRLIGQFLYWLQEGRARVFIVATANDVSKLPPELLRRGRFDELFFVDLPTPEERVEIITLYVKRHMKFFQMSQGLLDELVRLSDGFAGADLSSTVADVAKCAIRDGDENITDQTFKNYFTNVMPLSKTSPEQIEAIRSWGRERAVPASGLAIGGVQEGKSTSRRRVIFSGN